MLFILSYDDCNRQRGVKALQKRSAKKQNFLQPIDAPRGLPGELVARLTADIVSGKLLPGSRLPTEQEMIAATGVSRTVVREAVAALKADRLVVTRQGVGAFVADTRAPPLPGGFRRAFAAARRAQCHGAAHRRRNRGGGARRRARLAGPGQEGRRSFCRSAKDDRQAAATPPSIRISPSIARSPTPPAIRSSGGSSNISAASSFPGAPCGAARRRPQAKPARTVPGRACADPRRDPRPRRRRGARRDAAASASTAAPVTKARRRTRHQVASPRNRDRGIASSKRDQ